MENLNDDYITWEQFEKEIFEDVFTLPATESQLWKELKAIAAKKEIQK